MRKLFLTLALIFGVSAAGLALDVGGADATIGGCSATKITSGVDRARCTTVNNIAPYYSQWAFNTTCHYTWGYSNTTTGWHYVSTSYYSATCASPGVISASGVFVFK